MDASRLMRPRHASRVRRYSASDYSVPGEGTRGTWGTGDLTDADNSRYIKADNGKLSSFMVSFYVYGSDIL